MPRKRVSKLSFMKPESNKVQAWYARNKPYINTALDFVPVVGGINRAVQGDYPMAATNWLLDATGPVKWGAKGIKLFKAGRQVKKADKLLSSFSGKPLTDKTKKEISKATKNYINAVTQYDRIGKAIPTKSLLKNVLTRGIIQSLPISYHNRLSLGDGVGHALGAPNATAVLKQAFNYYFNNKIYPNRLLNRIGNSYLLSDKEQEEYLKKFGLIKTNDFDGINKIRKATEALLKDKGRKTINMYQIGNDEVPRDSVYPIPIDSVPKSLLILNKGTKTADDHWGVPEPTDLINPGEYPTIYYKHKNPKKHLYYYRDIDLNDYGKHYDKDTKGFTYDYQYLANLYDLIGNPFIQKTGIKYLGSYKYGGTIHIKKKNRGKFTATKKRTGKTTEELTHSKNPLTRKRAIFAQNARKWNHG